MLHILKIVGRGSISYFIYLVHEFRPIRVRNCISWNLIGWEVTGDPKSYWLEQGGRLFSHVHLFHAWTARAGMAPWRAGLFCCVPLMCGPPLPSYLHVRQPFHIDPLHFHIPASRGEKRRTCFQLLRTIPGRWSHHLQPAGQSVPTLGCRDTGNAALILDSHVTG